MEDTTHPPLPDRKDDESLPFLLPERQVILEPIQAEGGVIIPPTGYLRDVQDLCHQYGAFLVVDEIQTGMGRLGSWWGCDCEGVVPDVLSIQRRN